MNYSATFDLDENKAEVKLEPLVNEPYSFENIINNPIIKPISECDRGIRDLEEIKIKALIDLNKEKELINQALIETPEYNDITFVGNLLRMVSKISDIIKIDDLQMKKYVDCIREINMLIRKNYKIEDEHGNNVSPPNVDHRAYLVSLIENINEEIASSSKEILKEFESIEDTDPSKRYEKACVKVYTSISEKSKKVIIAKIMRMEL